MFQVDDAEIQVIFLPPNVTSFLQPMDQGIINAFKVIYKSNFLRRVLLETDSDRPVTEVIKSFSLYDAIQLATDAWATVTPETIANCWRNLLSQDQNYNSFKDFTISSPTSDPRVLLSKVVQLVDPNYELTEEEVQEWLSNSDNIDVAQIYTDEQLAKPLVVTFSRPTMKSKIAMLTKVLRVILVLRLYVLLEQSIRKTQ
ncbi:tigger transposable element-derived protein 1-like [Toxorhynchites rutilus septentrionalis]|uniref:tigger transposable element-derived protein 1-like n=1 Tax=Toxorhynchites rutilus septentrionalis TaxID=329112 RepID=UPI00247A8B10|nr:tigger transposable element-derived protein 1-like [Toxorhynchites rutilus septentrionalis]